MGVPAARALFAMMFVAAGGASAAPVPPACTDASRACLLKTATIYLDGLSRHDASAIPFSPDVRATEQAGVVVTNEKTFRSEIEASTAITGIRNLRLFADPETGSVGAFYVLDIAGENGKPPYSVWRGQRFRVMKGHVTEVEVYNYFDPDSKGLGRTNWPGGTSLPVKR